MRLLIAKTVLVVAVLGSIVGLGVLIYRDAAAALAIIGAVLTGWLLGWALTEVDDS